MLKSPKTLQGILKFGLSQLDVKYSSHSIVRRDEKRIPSPPWSDPSRRLRLKGCYVAAPLKWNSLDEAAVWLSDKTKESWTSRRIIDFAIDQCRPDDIIEDYKYPTYLRTVFPEAISDYLSRVSLRLDDSSAAYVYESIELDERKIRTTFVFKDNLIELNSTGKTAICFISYHDHSVSEITGKLPQLRDYEVKPVMVYCELRLMMFIDLDEPYPEFPTIPIIQIDFETLGIRDEELKQLLRDYLALPKKETAKKNPRLRESIIHKAEFQSKARAMWEKNPNLTRAEILEHKEMEFYVKAYPGKNTLPSWFRDVDPRPKEKRNGRPKKHPST